MVGDEEMRSGAVDGVFVLGGVMVPELAVVEVAVVSDSDDIPPLGLSVNVAWLALAMEVVLLLLALVVLSQDALESITDS